jgi:chemosensory pili system protein ChpA (sensor histidine kinase/response regulator)
VVVVPTSRALQDAVLVLAAGQKWGIPAIAVLDRLAPEVAASSGEGVHRVMDWDGLQIPVRNFAAAVGLVESDPITRLLVVSSPSGPVAFAVAAEIGDRQVATRELGPLLDGVPHLTGAALLGGGDVVVVVDPSRLAERARAIRDRDRSQPRVLVVDDSQGARQVVGGALGSAGFDVTLAGTAEEALSLVEQVAFDAIVTDYVLPAMDGATLVRKIRGLGVTAPVVVLSGLATPHDQARALTAGADLYFDKGDVRRGALADALRRMIGGLPTQSVG